MASKSAGRVVRIEKEDRDNIRLEATMVKSLSLESTRWRPISYGERWLHGGEPAIWRDSRSG